jgi:ABC-type antimicrobial peptide transport system permease subunit
MGIPLRSGRLFTDADRLGSQSVVVIDEVLAQQAFPRQDPIGKPIWGLEFNDPATIIGVVGHVRQFGLAGDDEAKIRGQLYYPFAQVPDKLVRRWSQLMSVAIRSSVDPAAIMPRIREVVRGTASDQTIYLVRTMDQLARNSIAPERFLLVLFAVFAGLALLLASIGIYGVLAYLTNQRVPEMAIRMALGSSARGVMRMVLKDSFQMVLIGVAVGAAGAWAADRVLLRVVQGSRPGGVLTFIGMIVVLCLAALLASLAPARRAARVDPLTALRSE